MVSGVVNMTPFKLFTCFSPKRVYNTRLGREVVTSCGNCAYCLAVKSADHTNRVKREFIRNGESLALFLTLTYDNNHLPCYQYNGRSKRWFSNVSCADARFEPIKSDEVYLYPSPERYYVGKTIKRSDARSAFRRHDRPTFAHLYYPDVQHFIARVRTSFHHFATRKTDSALHNALKTSNLSYESLRFRYAVCGEYGPATFRPHYHLILWFSTRFADSAVNALSQVLSACWSLGRFDCQTVTTDGVSNYLASYISSLSSLPNVLKAKYLRPFFRFSQCPTLGIVSLDDAQIQEMLATGDAYTTRYDDEEKRHVPTELPRASLNRYFPKCQGFGYEDYKRTLARISYVYNYFVSSARGLHSPSDVDALRLRDIPFPVRFVKPSELDYYDITGKSTQRIGADGLWHWSREDRYSSLVTYRYCVKYGLTPDLVLDAFYRIYARAHSRRLGQFYEAINLGQIELQKAVNFDPFVLADMDNGSLCTSSVASYLGVDLDEFVSSEKVLSLCSDDDGKLSHIGEYTHLTDSLVKKKKLNDYKVGRKSVLRVFGKFNN